MQEINPHFVENILERIKEKSDAINDKDLAALFEVKPGTISAWRTRNSIDLNKLTLLCEEKCWSLDEIILGKSTKCNIDTTNSIFDLNDYIESKDKKMDELNREIGRLLELNRLLKMNEKSNI